MSRTIPLVLVVGVLASAVAGCGRKSDDQGAAPTPSVGVKGGQKQAAQDLGFPTFATKNTSRVGGADPTADAAAIARAVFPGTRGQQPTAVVLSNAADWRATLAASSLMAPPIGAPQLFATPQQIPPASAGALQALHPLGSKPAGGAQVIRIGNVARPASLKTTDVSARNPYALARAIDAFGAAARGTTSDHVLVVSAQAPQFAMPAAAWAAKSGDPILFVDRDAVPPDTRAAIAAHQQPKIYVLGPSKIISPKVTAQLRKLGTVVRVVGADPVRNAIEFARYSDGSFGWGVVDPGHGVVFMRSDADPSTAAAAAPLSASGTYGPAVLLGDADTLERPMRSFLLDIEPGYTKDPVRGVYNRGWIVGDTRQVSSALQSRIDSLLEIIPVSQKGNP